METAVSRADYLWKALLYRRDWLPPGLIVIRQIV